MSDEFARNNADYKYLLHRHRASEERRQLGEELTRRMIDRATWQLDLSRELLKQSPPKITPFDQQ